MDGGLGGCVDVVCYQDVAQKQPNHPLANRSFRQSSISITSSNNLAIFGSLRHCVYVVSNLLHDLVYSRNKMSLIVRGGFGFGLMGL